MTESAPAGGVNRRESDRLLRRSDWRFLLANPAPSSSVCFTAGPLAGAVGLISERMVERDPPVASCDLAVAVSPDEAVLRRAWSALRPGGSLYAEWPRPLAGGPRRARKRLAAAGFTGVRCYFPWPWPSRAPARVWLPLDARGACRFWLVSRSRPRGTRQWLLHVLRRAAWYVTGVAQLALPVCVVAQKPPAAGDLAEHPRRENRDVAASLPDALLQRWPGLDLGPPPNRLACLLLTSGQRSFNKVVGLLFADQDDEPRLVVKMPRVPAASRTLRREAANLHALHALPFDGMAGVPRVLFVQEHGCLVTLGQVALTGVPIGSMLGPENYRHLALTVTRWLIDFAGRSHPSSPALWWDPLVAPVLKDVTYHLTSIVGRDMLEETVRIVSTLGPLPLVREHRDFGPYNIMIDGRGGVVVLDWENAQLPGLPALDLIYFLAYLAFYLDGANELARARASYRAALDPETFTGSVQRECLDYYMSRVQIDPASLGPLRLLTWLVHCQWLCRHLAEESGGRADAEVLRGSTPLAMWSEELRAQRSRDR